MNCCPQKLRDLNELNKLMAHRPWLIDKTHIEKLTRGQSKWTLSELMHAVALLAHFHSLSSFVQGAGISIRRKGFVRLMDKIKDLKDEKKDFIERDKPNVASTFRVHEFSWEDQGFSLSNRLFTDLGTILDDKFNAALSDVDAFRRSVWDYVQCLFGIRHDDYDYSEMNALLEMPWKSYIKKVACKPEEVEKTFDCFLEQFDQTEKIRIVLTIAEARLQSELLYVLRAITRFMTEV